MERMEEGRGLRGEIENIFENYVEWMDFGTQWSKRYKRVREGKVATQARRGREG